MKTLLFDKRLALLLVLLALGAFWTWNRQQPPTVQGRVLEPAPYEDLLLITGKVRLDNAIRLRTEAGGIVSERLAAEGTAVKAGTPLLTLRNEEIALGLSKAEADLALAEAELLKTREQSTAAQEATLEQLRLELEQLDRDLARTRSLHQAAAASDSQLTDAESAAAQKAAELRAETARLQQTQRDITNSIAAAEARVKAAALGLETARLQASRLTLQAPFEGIVTDWEAAPGDRLSAGDAVLSMAKSLGKTCEVAPDEKYLPLLAVGQSVVLKADARPEDPIPGTVIAIAPEVDATAGTVAVKILIGEDRPWLLQNLMLRCEVQLGSYPDSLSVPADFLIPGEPPSLMVFENGTAVLRKVVAAASRSGSVRILEGVEPGDVILPPVGLTSGQRVRLAVPEGGSP